MVARNNWYRDCRVWLELFVLANLTVDLLQTIVNPRLRKGV